MRTAMLMGYAFCVGWYVRASGLDEELAQLGRDAYARAVSHTARLALTAARTAGDSAESSQPEVVTAGQHPEALTDHWGTP